MAYVAPTMTAAGLQYSSYQDIQSFLIDSYRSIFGQNVNLSVATPDYQFVSVFAAMISDCNQGLALVYQNRAPVTAISAGLDAIVTCNGLTRLSASSGTVQLSLTGTAGTVINAGEAQDANGESWILPQTVTIGPSGNSIVIATCADPGSINADIGTVTIIGTPVLGWQSVTNTIAAVPGAAQEADDQLRERQALSVQGPSVTPLGSVVAAVSAVDGVTRYNILENYTSAVDANGLSPHSICVVAEGGTDLNIATTIDSKKTIGADTNGASGFANTTTIGVINTFNQSQTNISFLRPVYVPVYVTVNVKPLAGYTTATATLIQTQIDTYLNDLIIGQPLYMSELFSAALTANANLLTPTFAVRSVLFGTTASPATSSDLALTFNQVAQGLTTNISVVTVS